MLKHAAKKASTKAPAGGKKARDDSVTQTSGSSGHSSCAIPLRNSGVPLRFAPTIADQYQVEVVLARSRAKCAVCNCDFKEGELRVGTFAKGTGDFLQVSWNHLGCAYTTPTRLYPGLFANVASVAGFTALPTNVMRDDVLRLACRAWHPVSQKAFGASFVKSPFAEAVAAGASATGVSAADLDDVSGAMAAASAALGDMPTNDMRELFYHNNPQLDDVAKAKIARMDRAQMVAITTDFVTFGVPAASCSVCRKGAYIPKRGPLRYVCCGNIDEFTPCGDEHADVKRRPFDIPSRILTGKNNSQRVTLQTLAGAPRRRCSAAACAAHGLDELLHASGGGKSLRDHVTAIDDDPTQAFFGVVFDPMTKTALPSKQIAKLKELGATVQKSRGKASLPFSVCVDDQRPSQPTHRDSLTVTPQWVTWAIDRRRCLTLAEAYEELRGRPQLSTQLTQAIAELRSTSTSASSASDGDGVSPAGDTSVEVSFAGSAPIDSECSYAKSGKPFVTTADGFECNATFSKVDLKTGSNSFYVLQLIDLGNRRALLFRRWGRLGERTGKKEETLGMGAAHREFARLFTDRTGVEWDARSTYEKQPGFYNWVNQPRGDTVGDAAPPPQVADVTSTATAAALAPATVKLLELLFDEREIQRTMQTMQIDTQKMPLAGLTLNSVDQGQAAIKAIEAALGKLKRAKTDAARRALRQTIIGQTNRFYSSVPHVIGDSAEVRDASILDSPEKLRDKVLLLDDLRNILFTKATVKTPSSQHYASLECNLEWISPSDPDAVMVRRYAENTHGRTHRKFSVDNVWRMERHGEATRFENWKDNKNRMLLWHGSRLTNWVRIMAQGLRIAPPEAPSTGYMFGKGVYFADMFTKSANYCFADHGLLCLAEVALGSMQERTAAHYVERLDAQYQATYAKGATHPDRTQDITLPNGTVVPTGTAVSDDKYRHASLLYNEYIVYDTTQVRMCYLVEVNKH